MVFLCFAEPGWSMLFPEVQQFQHNRLQDTVLVETSGFHTVLRVKADVHGFLYLPVAPARGLADVLIHGKGRNAQGRAEIYATLAI